MRLRRLLFGRLTPLVALVALIMGATIESPLARSAGLSNDAVPSGRTASAAVAKLAAQDAGKLADWIRSEARRGGPSSMTAVKTLNGCCGIRALEVYEPAPCRVGCRRSRTMRALRR